MANLFGSESTIMQNGYNYKRRKKDLYFTMKFSEYVLMSEFFEFHRKHLKETLEKEKNKILTAYIHANGIFDITPTNKRNGEKEETEESISEMLEMLAMSKRIRDKMPTFRKSLNQ